jgi:hypothetical protein
VLANIPIGSVVPCSAVNFVGLDGVTLWAYVVYSGLGGYVKMDSVFYSVFPEYDPAYPISDPENPPDGSWHFTMPDGTARSTNSTATLATIYAAGGILTQGPAGTRYPCLDGHWDYMVHDRDSYALYGHQDAPYQDSSLTYTDPSVANQELTERALYVSVFANFKRFGHPHHTVTCTAPGLGRPTRAGDLIAVDYGRVSGDEGGAAVVEMAVQEIAARDAGDALLRERRRADGHLHFEQSRPLRR